MTRGEIFLAKILADGPQPFFHLETLAEQEEPDHRGNARHRGQTPGDCQAAAGLRQGVIRGLVPAERARVPLLDRLVYAVYGVYVRSMGGLIWSMSLFTYTYI